MAASKRNTRSASLKGIPKKHHEALRSYFHFYVKPGENITPQEAYSRMQQMWKKNAEERQQIARKRVVEAFDKLGSLDELLEAMSDDNLNYIDGQSACQIAFGMFRNTMAELEQSLFDLGIVEGTRYKGRVEGRFNDVLAFEAAEAGHGAFA